MQSCHRTALATHARRHLQDKTILKRGGCWLDCHRTRTSVTFPLRQSARLQLYPPLFLQAPRNGRLKSLQAQNSVCYYHHCYYHHLTQASSMASCSTARDGPQACTLPRPGCSSSVAHALSQRLRRCVAWSKCRMVMVNMHAGWRRSVIDTTTVHAGVTHAGTGHS